MQNSQEVAKTIKKVAKSQNIKTGDMLSDCGLSINTLSSMQSGGYYPRLEAIAKIADYLDCSVDYLLGRIDNPEIQKNAVANEGDSDIKVLYNKIICLDQDDRQTVDGLVDTLLSKDKYKKISSNVG